MTQPRSMSFLEAVTNVAIGWLVALATQMLAFPMLGIQASLPQNLALSAIFTAVSLARSYVIRRLFNRIGAIAVG